MSTATDQKPQVIKKVILLSITLTFRRCDFCGFRNVAVNIMNKLQFLKFMVFIPYMSFHLE